MKSKCFTMLILPLLLMFIAVTASTTSSPSTTSIPAQSPSKTLETMLSNHLQLARLLNSILFRNDVAVQGGLMPEDVLAGFWSLQEPKDILNVSSIDLTALSSNLEVMISDLQTIPDGLEIGNMVGIETSIGNFNSTSQADRDALEMAANFQDYPIVLTSPHTFRNFDDFSTNHVSGALWSIETFDSNAYPNSLPTNDLNQILKDLRLCQNYFDETRLADWRAFIALEPAKKHLTVLTDGIDVANRIGRFHANNPRGFFGNFYDQLDGISNEMGNFSSLLSIVNQTHLSQQMSLLNDSLGNLATPPDHIPMGAVLSSLSRNGQVNDEWLKKALTFDKQQKSSYEMFTSSYTDLKPLIDRINEMPRIKYGKFQQTISKLNSISENAEQFSALQSYVISNLTLRNSLEKASQRPTDYQEVAGLSKDLKTIDTTITNFLSYVDTMKAGGTAFLQTAIYTIEADKATKKCKDTSGACHGALVNVKTLLSSWNPSVASITNLMDTRTTQLISKLPDRLAPVENTKNWLLNVTSFLKTDIETFDVKLFQKLNNISKEIQTVKKIIFLPTFKQDITNWINSTKSGLAEIETNLEAIRKTKPKNISEFVKHREILLEVVGGVSALERLFAIKTKAEKVIEGATSVVQKLLNEDTALRVSIGLLWSTFSDTAQETLEKELLVKMKVLERLNLTVNPNITDMISFYQNGTEDKVSLRGVDVTRFIESLEALNSSSSNVTDYIEQLYDIDESLRTTNWDLQYASFQKMPDALLDAETIFYNILRGSRTTQSIKKVEHELPEGLGMHKVVSIILFCLSILIFAAGASLAGWRKFGKKKRKPKTKLPKPVVDTTLPPYTCSEENYKFSFLQLQDARLKINKYDKFHRTLLFRALEKNDYEEAKRLLEAGALVDKVCSFEMFTPLYLAVISWDQKMVELLLKHGAWIYQPTVIGKNANTFADAFNFQEIFDEHNFREPCKRTIPPNQPRFFHILVVDPRSFSSRQRSQLPANILSKITWGYRKRMKLNQFSHIVLSRKYVSKDGKTVILSKKKAFIWKCVAALGSLMSDKWLTALLSDPDALHNDIPFMLLNTQFNDTIHPDALLKLKSDPHRGRPKFLQNVCIHFLPTSNSQEMAKQKVWSEVFAMFSAQIVKRPVACTKKTLEPYSAQYMDYFMSNDWQSAMWIIKYPDSPIDRKWRADWAKCTLIPIDFVFECIASYRILPVSNKVVPIDTLRPVPNAAPCAGFKKIQEKNEQEINRSQMRKLALHFEQNPTESWKKLQADCAKAREKKDQQEMKRKEEVEKQLEEELEKWRANIRAPMSESSDADMSRASRKSTKTLDDTQKESTVSRKPTRSNKTKELSAKSTQISSEQQSNA